jgi:hypothetical protein
MRGQHRQPSRAMQLAAILAAIVAAAGKTEPGGSPAPRESETK